MNDRSNVLRPREDAGRASAEIGFVILDGPDGVAVTMTADAAAKTADSLYAAAKQARLSGPGEASDASRPTDQVD